MSESDSSMTETLGAARRVLSGDRVRLRELRDADLPALVRWWRDPEVAVFNDRVQPRPDQPLQEMFRGWSDNGTGAGAAFSVETLQEELVGRPSQPIADRYREGDPEQ